MAHRTIDELEREIDLVRSAPTDVGVLEMIVRRPAENEREVLEQGTLDREHGLVGDDWATRGSPRTDDGSAHPDMQLNVMSTRVIGLLAERDRWPLAGDQLYVDLDLSEENLPAGTQLSIGTAVIEITDQPHRGCAKFRSRFGADALRWVNSPEGRALRLRGANARVVTPGTIHPGDLIHRLPSDH